MRKGEKAPSLQNQLSPPSATIPGAPEPLWVLGDTQQGAQIPRAHRASARARPGPAHRPRENPAAELARGGPLAAPGRRRSPGSPARSLARSHARRCCGSAGHVTAGPPPSGAPCRLTVTQHSARAARPVGVWSPAEAAPPPFPQEGRCRGSRFRRRRSRLRVVPRASRDYVSPLAAWLRAWEGSGGAVCPGDATSLGLR